MTTSPHILTDQQQEALQVIAQQTGKSEDELVQDAVEQLIRQFQRNGLQERPEIEPEQAELVATATTESPRKRRPRQGWAAQFKAMAANGDDRLSEWGEHNLTTWDEDEWEW